MENNCSEIATQATLNSARLSAENTKNGIIIGTLCTGVGVILLGLTAACCYSLGGSNREKALMPLIRDLNKRIKNFEAKEKERQ